MAITSRLIICHSLMEIRSTWWKLLQKLFLKSSKNPKRFDKCVNMWYRISIHGMMMMITIDWGGAGFWRLLCGGGLVGAPLKSPYHYIITSSSSSHHHRHHHHHRLPSPSPSPSPSSSSQLTGGGLFAAPLKSPDQKEFARLQFLNEPDWDFFFLLKDTFICTL